MRNIDYSAQQDGRKHYAIVRYTPTGREVANLLKGSPYDDAASAERLAAGRQRNAPAGVTYNAERIA